MLTQSKTTSPQKLFIMIAWHCSIPTRYSVTQSFANSFWGYVVLDSFNNVSRDEDNILYQIYMKQMCSDFYYEDEVLRAIEENAYIKKYSSQQERAHKIEF